MEYVAGVKSFGGGRIVLEAPPAAVRELVERQAKTVRLIVPDPDKITPQQRNKIFALVSDIADYASGVRRGDKRRQREVLCALQLSYLIDTSDHEAVRERLTYHYCQLCGVDLFSLSERSPDAVSKSIAGDFIDWLVELCITCGVPCTDTLLNRCEDVTRYLYACVMHRTCAVCGKPADIHEWDRVGIGRDRDTIHHAGQRVQPLCRVCHGEAHDMGQQTFDELHHITWIRLTEEMCEKLGWKK